MAGVAISVEEANTFACGRPVCLSEVNDPTLAARLRGHESSIVVHAKGGDPRKLRGHQVDFADGREIVFWSSHNPLTHHFPEAPISSATHGRAKPKPFKVPSVVATPRVQLETRHVPDSIRSVITQPKRKRSQAPGASPNQGTSASPSPGTSASPSPRVSPPRFARGNDRGGGSGPGSSPGPEPGPDDIQALERELEQLNGVWDKLQDKKRQGERYIKLLHSYNETKDVAQLLMGKLAELEGLTTKDMYERFDLDLND